MTALAKLVSASGRSLAEVYVSLCTGLIGIGVLGALVGTLAGLSGPEPTIVAALISAVVALFGGLLVWVLRRFNPLEVLTASLAALIFTVSFSAMAIVSNAWRETVSNERHEEAYVKAARAHFDHIERCSKLEKYFNSKRAELELKPLGPEYYCRKPPGLYREEMLN